MKLAAGVQIPEVPLALLRESFANPRKSFDAAAQAELADSIRLHGIQSPLLVRVFPDSALHAVKDTPAVKAGELFEIVCGHRRFRAAKELGLKTVPCIQRELTDEQAAELALIDNLQRAEVGALEEADAYAELRKRLGTAAAIAQRVGKDVAYVTKRLALVSLAEMPRKALAERLITIDHALLLARLGGAEQDQNLKWALSPSAGVKEKLESIFAARVKDLHDTNHLWEPQSPARLREHIEEHVGRKLSRAPWDLAASNLTEDRRPCVGCPSNTADNTALFGDLAIDEATCEDGRCFEQKRATFVHIRVGDASVDGKPAIRISWKDSAARPRSLDDDGRYLAQTFRHGQWVEAKKGSCGFARAAVTVDWSDDNHHGFGPHSGKLRKPGEVLTVCVAAGCKTHPKAWEKVARAAASGDGGSRETWQQREAREASETDAFAAKENPVRRALYDAILAKLTPARMLRMVLEDAAEQEHICRGLGLPVEDDYDANEKRAKAAITKARDAELALLLFHSLYAVGLECHHYHIGRKDRGREFLRQLAKRVGVNAAAIEQRAEQAVKAAAAKPVAPKAEKKAPAKQAAKKGGRK